MGVGESLRPTLARGGRGAGQGSARLESEGRVPAKGGETRKGRGSGKGLGTSGCSLGNAEKTRRGGVIGGGACVTGEEPKELKKLGKGTNPEKVGGGTREGVGLGVAGAGLGQKG